jgi:hypothetical protein
MDSGGVASDSLMGARASAPATGLTRLSFTANWASTVAVSATSKTSGVRKEVVTSAGGFNSSDMSAKGSRSQSSKGAPCPKKLYSKFGFVIKQIKRMKGSGRPREADEMRLPEIVQRRAVLYLHILRNLGLFFWPEKNSCQMNKMVD